jgi:hypothetical protein
MLVKNSTQPLEVIHSEGTEQLIIIEESEEEMSEGDYQAE